MVDFSLRKTKGFQRQGTISKHQISQPTQPKHVASSTTTITATSKIDANPYAQLNSSAAKANTSNSNANVNPYANIPSLPNAPIPNSMNLLPLPQSESDRVKMGKSMQRRMSVHLKDNHDSVRNIGNNASAMPALPKVDLSIYQMGGNSDTAGEHHDQTTDASPQQSQAPLLAAVSTSSSVNPVKSRTNFDLTDPESIKLLSSTNFNAESFITSQLSDSTASEISKFSNILNSLNKQIVNDMNSLSLQTFDKLIQSSKELQTIETELRLLRGNIRELTDVNLEMRESAEKRVLMELEQTNSELARSNTAAKSPTTANSQSYRRQSLTILSNLWHKELQSLFKHVEGATKYITAIPGRHIIAESGRWYELNAATFKKLQPAHVFILNDLVFIATRRRKVQRRTNLVHGKDKSDNDMTQDLIADQCWPLREIKLTEIDSPNSTQNVHTINITYNSLSYTYQTDRHDQYLKIIKAFKSARDELRDITEAEDIRRRKLRDSMQVLSNTEGFNESNSPIAGGSRRASGSQSRKSSTGGGGTGVEAHSPVIGRKLSTSSHSHRRSSSHSSMLQDITTRMHTANSNSKAKDKISANSELLKAIDDEIDLQDIQIFRKSYAGPINTFENIESQLHALKESIKLQQQSSSAKDNTEEQNSIYEEQLLLCNILTLKIQSGRQTIIKDLSSRLKYGDSSPSSFGSTKATASRSISSASSPLTNKSLHQFISYLCQLDQGPLARKLYLAYQTDMINDLLSRIPSISTGPYTDSTAAKQPLDKANTNSKSSSSAAAADKITIQSHIIELSIVLFQNLKVTIINYKPLFPTPSEWSYLTHWITTQTFKFINGRLSALLQGVKLTKSEIEWCLVIVRRQYLELKDFGVDLSWVMEEGFFAKIAFEEDQQQ